MRLQGKRVLLTGAAGFIGSHVCEALLESGASVRAFVRYNSRNDRGMLDQLPQGIMQHVEVCAGDLKDGEAVRRAVRGCQVVFHLGALISIPYSYVHPLDYVQTNVVGTAHVIHAALDMDVERVVCTSTSEVYGTAQYAPIDENHPLCAQSPYAASKIASDQLALSFYRSFGLPVVVVRPFNAFGPRQSARAIIPTIISQALMANEVRLGSLHPTRDLTFVRDTAAGFLAAAQADAAVGAVINLGTGHEISIGALAETIIMMVGRSVPVVTDEGRVRPAQSEVARLVCDAGKAERLVGWHPNTSLEAGLAETIAWIAENRGRYRIHEYTI